MGVDATLTFDHKGHIQGYKVYQFFAKLAYHSRPKWLTHIQIAAKKGRPSTSQLITGRSPGTFTAGTLVSDHSGT